MGGGLVYSLFIFSKSSSVSIIWFSGFKSSSFKQFVHAFPKQLKQIFEQVMPSFQQLHDPLHSFVHLHETIFKTDCRAECLFVVIRKRLCLEFFQPQSMGFFHIQTTFKFGSMYTGMVICGCLSRK